MTLEIGGLGRLWGASRWGGTASFTSGRVDLSGHHSNTPAALEGLLNDAFTGSGAGRESSRTCAMGGPGGPLATAHPRQGRIIDAISQVLIAERAPMRARDVHARVETLLDEPVRWASVKATLAGNLNGPAPRFVRIARGRYGVPRSAHPSTSYRTTHETPSSSLNDAWSV